MPILYHATPARNRQSIATSGLLTDYSVGRWRAVWLHTAKLSARLVPHVARRHGCDVADVVVIPVRVCRSRLRRFSRGIWYTFDNVKPDWLILPFDLPGQVTLYAECPF